MKFSIAIILILVSGLFSMAAEYSSQVRDALNEIRKDVSKDGLPLMEGHISGYPGHSGAFIIQYPKIYGISTSQDVEKMLSDPNPVVRLTGAKVALSRGPLPPSLSVLSTDSTRLVVGPLHQSKQLFKQMTVSEVLTEIRYDPLFLTRPDFGRSVHIEHIKESGRKDGSTILIANLPDYPLEMARAGVSGDVTLKIRFTGNLAQPEIVILKSSHREFEEPTIWAVSKWKVAPQESGEQKSQKSSEFECRFLFNLADDQGRKR